MAENHEAASVAAVNVDQVGREDTHRQNGHENGASSTVKIELKELALRPGRRYEEIDGVGYPKITIGMPFA